MYKHIYTAMAITLQWIMRCIKLQFDNSPGRFNGLQCQHDCFTSQCNSQQVIAVVYRAIVMDYNGITMELYWDNNGITMDYKGPLDHCIGLYTITLGLQTIMLTL